MLTCTKPNMILRINYEKCTVSLRNQRLVELASSRIGETTAQVYAELLRLLEDKIPGCRLEPKIDDTEDLPDGPSVTTREIAASLSRSVNVGSGIGKASEDAIDATMGHKTTGSRKRKADEAEVDGEVSADEEEYGDDADDVNGDGNIPEVDLDDLDDPFADDITTKAPKRAKVTFQDKLPKPEHTEDRQNRTRQIKDHLSLLAGDSCKFVRNSGSRGEGEWTVDFDRIIAHLQEAELDQMLLENFGRTGHRLARMMRTLGKLEEKQLPTLAFMKQKDIRTKLAEMQMAGMIDIQEVPRDNSRTTGRTIFLWYFDTERVSTLMLDSIYKSMSRCIQRLDIEKRRAQDILSLTERSDVRDLKEEDYLDQSQINQLQEIRRKEESLLGQIGRLDDLVGIFRDY
jgi:DNA-directed RNA polymerase III subunit RPC3